LDESRRKSYHETTRLLEVKRKECLVKYSKLLSDLPIWPAGISKEAHHMLFRSEMMFVSRGMIMKNNVKRLEIVILFLKLKI
jgi:hypothetical protein